MARLLPKLRPGEVPTWPIVWFTSMKAIREAPTLNENELALTREIASHCDPELLPPIPLEVYSDGSVRAGVDSNPHDFRTVLIAYEAGMRHLRVMGIDNGLSDDRTPRAGVRFGQAQVWGGEQVLGGAGGPIVNAALFAYNEPFAAPHEQEGGP